jgi:UDP-glucose 4-epimerase
MKCLILGGGGFLGSHLCEGLLAEGNEVRVFDRPAPLGSPSPSRPRSVEWLEGDFVNPADITRALAGCEVVYHLVSTTLPQTSNENPVYDVESNVVSTVRMMELARRNPVRKIIFISSAGTVYGIPQEVPIPETHPTNPVCSYGIGKLAIEKYLHLFCTLYGLQYCVLRLANPFGERQKVTGAQGAVAVFLHKALRDEPIEIWGDGSVVRDYLYVGDAIRALLKAKSCATEPPIFNIGSGADKSLNQLIQAIEALIHRPVKRKHLPARAFDVPVNVLDISRAAKELQWHPEVSFEDGLARTLGALSGGKIE